MLLLLLLLPLLLLLHHLLVPMLCDSGDIVDTNAFVVDVFDVDAACASDVAVVAASGAAVVVVSIVAPCESRSWL